MLGGPEFDEDHWHNNPMDGLYDHDALLGYMLRGSVSCLNFVGLHHS